MTDDSPGAAIPPITEAGQVASSPGNIAPYDLQDEIVSAVETVRFHTMVTFSRLATTYQMAAFCAMSKIDGAFVECGVWMGGAAGVMALAHLRNGHETRELHLFDSFLDLCQPDAEVDGSRAVTEAREWGHQQGALTGDLVPMEGFYDQFGGPGSAEVCRQLIVDKIGYPSHHVHIHEGWFQESMPRALPEIPAIAILRLDCDYYQSTKYCLDTLYERVVPGGFVIIDDYGWYSGCRLAVDEFLSTQSRPIFLHHADADGRYFVKN